MDLHASYPVTQFLAKANVSAGTTNTLTTAPTPAPAPYNIRSKTYSKAAVTNGAVPTVDFGTGQAFKPVPVGSASVFVLAYDAAGVLRVMQGSIETLDGGGGFGAAPQFPAAPDSTCPFAYLLVRVGSGGAAWTFGASNFSGATGVTYTFQDVSAIPDRPQIS